MPAARWVTNPCSPRNHAGCSSVTRLAGRSSTPWHTANHRTPPSRTSSTTSRRRTPSRSSGSASGANGVRGPVPRVDRVGPAHRERDQERGRELPRGESRCGLRGEGSRGPAAVLRACDRDRHMGPRSAGSRVASAGAVRPGRADARQGVHALARTDRHDLPPHSR